MQRTNKAAMNSILTTDFLLKKGKRSINIQIRACLCATIRHPNGAVIVIPPRPFPHPVMVAFRDEVIANYRDAIARALKE